MPANDVASEYATPQTADRAARRTFVREMFSAIAPRYDLLNHLLSLNIDRRWRRRAIAELNWQAAPEGTYVDLCAGTLDVAAMLARQNGFVGRVLGADFAEPMLRIGRKKVASDAVSAVVADALELPLTDGTANGAVVAFGIRNVSDVDAALDEAWRVLAPGARFVILEFTTPRRRLVRILYHLYFHRVLPVVGRVVSGHRSAYRYLPESVAHFPAEVELAVRMRRAGFVDVQWRSLSFGVAAVHVGTKP
jgi:demethylmenaquinone methyltransferase/2-methoxy-6-polyprenyl-1,4-benzoquinol methylase